MAQYGWAERGSAEYGSSLADLVLYELAPAHRRLAYGAGAALSLLLHGAILLAAVGWLASASRGAVRAPSDAISVELVAGTTLAAMQPQQPAEPAPSPAAMAPTQGSPQPSAASAAKAEERARPEAVEAPATASPDATGAAEPGERPAPPVPEAQADAPVPAVQASPNADAAGDAAAAQARQAKPADRKTARRVREGGVTSKAKAGNGRGGGRVAASTGAILDYAALVRARVAGNWPSGTVASGTAIVAFGLTSAGVLAYARIMRSSGNATNDRIALAAVRGAAPFPTPPAGATPGQLQFTIPYYFH